MPGTRGQLSQKTTFHVGATAAAKTITAAAKQNPVRLTSAAHGLAEGSVVLLAAFVGMVELNGQTGVVINVTTNTFDLAGIDSTNYGTYTSGGTATPTKTKLNGRKSWSGLDGQSSTIDDTDLDSDAKEKLAGLQDFGNFSIEGKHVSKSDPGIQALQSARAGGVPVFTTVTQPNGEGYTFNAIVKALPMQGGVDNTISQNYQLEISGQPTRF